MSILTSKQEAFVQEYMIDRNATQAAIRAGYSAKTANHNAVRLMVNDGIQQRIAELERKAAAEAEKTADEVRAKLISVAWSEDPNISMRDKLKALEMYAKHIGMDREAKKENLPSFNITVVSKGEIENKASATPLPPSKASSF